MARPKKNVDMEQLTKLMRFKPRLIDAAGFFDVSEDTIERTIKSKFKCTFAEFRDKNMAHTRMSLVQKALGKALAGDNTMLVWCMKNLCGWTDKVETVDADEAEEYSRPLSMRSA